MANNVTYFNAAFAGALAGANENWNTDTVGTDYDPVINAANAFATEFDSLVPLDGAPTVAKANLIEAICNSTFTGRVISSLVATDYAAIAGGLAAKYNRALLKLL